jgi:hypothetical protein
MPKAPRPRKRKNAKFYAKRQRQQLKNERERFEKLTSDVAVSYVCVCDRSPDCKLHSN